MSHDGDDKCNENHEVTDVAISALRLMLLGILLVDGGVAQQAAVG